MDGQNTNINIITDDNKIIRFKRDDNTGKVLHTDTEAGVGLSTILARTKDNFNTANSQVKTEDRFSYVFGILIIIVTEFLTLRYPQGIPQFYSLLLIGLVTKRYPEYAAGKWQLFMLDFCYFMNLSTIVQINLYPDNAAWFKTNYVLCMGCLMNAMVVWQNTVILHNIEKLTSLLLHVSAPFTLNLIRWGIIPCPSLHLEDKMTISDLIIFPLILYTIWQCLYLIMTELVLYEMMKNDPEIISSLRYLSSDTSNGMHTLVTNIMRRLGVMGAKEVFNAHTMKTKLIFVTAQFVYTLVTLIPVPLLYSSFWLSCLYITLLLGWTLWSGAGQYMNDFRERYKPDHFVVNDDVISNIVKALELK